MDKLIVIIRHFFHPFNPKWLFKTETINAPQFLASWEPRWNKVADPTNEEVYQRLSQLIDKNTAEIGAGYGRVATYLADKGLVVYPIEPNAILVDKIVARLDECGGEVKIPICAKAGSLPHLPVELYFSIRALEYCNFIELIRMSARLKTFNVPLITWERKGACARIRIAGWLTLNKKIYTQNLMR